MTVFPIPWQQCEILDEDRNLVIFHSLKHSHLICTRRPFYQATVTFLRSAFTSYRPDPKISLILLYHPIFPCWTCKLKFCSHYYLDFFSQILLIQYYFVTYGKKKVCLINSFNTLNKSILNMRGEVNHQYKMVRSKFVLYHNLSQNILLILY